MKKYLKVLNGFFIGNFMLLVSYILTYVDGNEIFMIEMSKMLEFKYFLAQFVFSGMSYLIVYTTIAFVKDFFRENYDNPSWRTLSGLLIIWVVIIIVSIMASLMIDRRGSLNGYVGEIFVGISILILIYGVFGNIIYVAIQNRKINKALKKRQDENAKD